MDEQGFEENVEKREGRDLMLPGSILVAGLLVAGAVIYSVGTGNTPGPAGERAVLSQSLGDAGDNEEVTTPQASVKIESYDVVLGDPQAPVTIIEFGDYQCPFCRKFFYEVESEVREKYISTGKVKMVWRDFAFLGPESVLAAQAAQCAKDEGKYWEYHDAIMDEERKDGREHNGNLNAAKFEEIAVNLEMNVKNFNNCLTEEKYKDLVNKAYNSAMEVGVRATPTVFINDRKVQGALPYSTFEAMIEEELK